MAREFDTSDENFDIAFDAFLSETRETEEDVTLSVTEILSAVKARGDDALVEFTERFDGLVVRKEDIRFSEAEIDAAFAMAETSSVDALNFAADRITSYHQRQLPSDDRYTDDVGIELGHRWTAIDAVGIYVPGGLASYPSTVLMNAIPAQVAGVKRIAMCVPASEGVINPLVLVAARIAGVEEIHRIGGAQAIAALTYGTESVRPVDKIVGPGNVYVATAKRLVFGQVGIDMIAGPSEIAVLADGENSADWVAADLLSQAEHDAAAQAILLTPDKALAGDVSVAIDARLRTLPKEAIARQSWEQHGAIILVRDLDDGADIVNRLAPEHLELAVSDPDKLLPLIRHAGSIFLGRYTPEAIGDYVAGPNHVLPTSGAARYASGLSVFEFMKRSSLISVPAEGLRRIGPAAMEIARAEGLDAHADSIAIRLNLVEDG